MATSPMLHLLCGKVAAGKSTLARRLGAAPLTVVIAQDYWMSRLYPEELKTFDDYLHYVPRLNGAMAGHVADLLRVGLSVVLDFPANRIASRKWMRDLVEATGVAHRLHFLDIPDAIARARLHDRNASGTHEYVVSDEEFARITSLFEPPTPDEGFEIEIYR